MTTHTTQLNKIFHHIVMYGIYTRVFLCLLETTGVTKVMKQCVVVLLGCQTRNLRFVFGTLITILLTFGLFSHAPSAHALTVSGVLYSNEGSTSIGQTHTIKIAVGTSTPPTIYTTTTGGGGYSFTFASLATSTPLLVWVDASTTVRATTFTKSSSTVNNIGLDLYQNRVIISHEGATTSTSTNITDLAFYDSDDDSDIQYNASSTANTFSIFEGNELHVWTGRSFTLAGSSTITGTVHIATSSILTAGNTTTIFGDYTNNGTFIAGTGTTTFSATTSTQTLSGTMTGTSAFNHVEFNGATTSPSSSGLVGAWLFEEGSGTNAADTSSNSNDGTLTNGPVWVSRGTDGALDFDGSNDYVNLGNNASLANITEKTISVWIKPDTLGDSNYGRILDKQEGGTGWELYMNSTNNVRFGQDFTDFGFWNTPNNSITLGTWQHVVVTYNSSSNTNDPSFYINGVLQTNAVDTNPTGASPADDSTRVLTIGDRTATDRSYNGSIDDVRIYNRILSADEIATLYSESVEKTFQNNASTTDFIINSGEVVAPDELSIAGDFSNDGIFTAGTGTTTFNGTTPQTLSGTMTGTSAFRNLILTNTSTVGSTTQSIVFANVASTTDTLTILASTSIQLPINATSTFQNISLEGVVGQPVYIRSSATGTKASFYVPGIQKNISSVNVRDSNACPTTIYASNGGIDAGNNTCWSFTVVGLILSGSLYSDEGVTPITTGKALAVIVGTSTLSRHQTTTDGSGDWSITIPEPHKLATSTPVLIFVDNDSVDASLFTKASSTHDINNLDLYQNRVIISHEGATTSTSTRISDLAFYDSDDDPDIQYNASSTSGTSTLIVSAGNQLYIKTGKYFTPYGAVTVSDGAGGGLDGSMYIAPDATYLTSATTTLAGTLTASSTALIRNHGTIVFNATAGKNIYATQPLGNLIFGGTGTYTFTSNATTTDVTINAGATVVAPAQLTMTGNYTNNGIFTAGSGTTTFGNDGSFFTSYTADAENQWTSVTYGNGKFVAIAKYSPNQIMTSDDGVTWTTHTTTGSYLYSVTFGNGRFVAVGESPTGYVITSDDGITWTVRTPPVSRKWYGVTYGNGLFVAVAPYDSGFGANSGDVMTSPDGITWTDRTPAEGNTWQSVTYGNGLFVAVSSNGTNRVMTSPDGITWTARSASEANNWNSVTYGNGLFVAVAKWTGTNRVMTSSDGITWTGRTVATIDWTSVTYGDGLFMASGGGRIMTSPDGINWTLRSTAEVNSWTSVTYGNGLFVAVSSNSTNQVMTASSSSFLTTLGDKPITLNGVATGTSAFNALALTGTVLKNIDTTASATNMVNVDGDVVVKEISVSGQFVNQGTYDAYVGRWSPWSASEANQWTSVTYGNGLFVAVSDDGTNRVMTSPDGITWTPQVGVLRRWNSVTYGNGLFVAVAAYDDAYSATTTPLMTSTDGINWTVRSVSEASNWYSITYGNGLFVAVAGLGTNRVMTSPDGITWTARSAAEANSWYSVTYGNGLFVAVTNSGTNRVMTSPDGITWTARSAAAANQWRSVTYGNGLFVAVASNGTNRVMTSPDGITWTARSAAEANFWYSVTYGNGLFVAVALTGTNRVMTSPDGITWTARSAAEANNWNSVTYGNGLFVAVSWTGTNRVMTSLTGTTTFTGASVQSASASASSTTHLGNAVFTGAGTKTLSATNILANDVTIATGATVVAPEQLSLSGSYTNNGTFTAGIGTTTFNGDSEQTVAGNMTATSSFYNVAFTGSSTKTFSSNASTSDFLIGTSSVIIAPQQLSITGNYRNVDGTFTAGSGTTTFNGTTPQMLSGTMVGISAFNNLLLTNTSTNGTSSQSIIFANPASTTDTLTVLASTSIQLPASATSTFQNISLEGAVDQNVYIRSSATGTKASFYVPGTQKLLTYVNVRDSNACPTTLFASTGGYDAGNNSCWVFTPNALLSSAENQTFGYGQATTSLSTLTITDNNPATITALNGIRILIATTSANMRWDTTDTSAVFGGTASGKVSNPVSYLGNGSMLFVPVTTDFNAYDTLTISGLSFAQFGSITAPVTALGLRTTGVGSTTDAVDDKAVAITGNLTLANHSGGNIGNAFDATSETGKEFFTFSFSPAIENANVSSLAFSLTDVTNIASTDLTNLLLYRDINSDKTYDVGDVAVGGSGVSEMTGRTGTITFSSSFLSTTTEDYLLIGDTAEMYAGDTLTISLQNIYIDAQGTTSLSSITVEGSTSQEMHRRLGVSRGGGGYGEAGGGVQNGAGQTSGGGNDGGNGIAGGDTGESLGSEPGFNPPASNGTPNSAWTTGANAYASDGVYATTNADATAHSFGTFGFSVPVSNEITGIAVKFEASASTSEGTISARLSWNNGSSVTAIKTTGTLTTSDMVYTLGGPSDLWGRSWTASEFNNGSFIIELISNTTGNVIKVDALKVRVYHQAVSQGGGGGGGGEALKKSDRYFASVHTAFSGLKFGFDSFVRRLFWWVE